ncbi:hypothetical protein BDN72DRAFT_904027 [Pluteus cervinus]|uniref:Uncharacterized protein n=1 Tax=Pluteus cervinus TaxID=181527 RepID=A0ACD3A792_9AGAR|nr:hypothetical protein BDN72DRAFT_904027 [Pluteus cervinus]
MPYSWSEIAVTPNATCATHRPQCPLRPPPTSIHCYHGVSAHLKTLASDLVHSILSDLSTKSWKLLIVHSHPSLDASVSTHPQLHPILAPSPEHFQNITQTFGLYLDIVGTMGNATWGAHRPVNILTEIQTVITKESDAFIQYFDLLNAYTRAGSPTPDWESWDLNDIPTLRALWMNIRDAENALNAKKAA